MDCESLGERIVAREAVVQRTSERVGDVFWRPRARTNLGLQSPIYQMLNYYSHVSRDYSVLIGPLSRLVALVLNHYGNAS